MENSDNGAPGAEQMRYGMLGDDPSGPGEKLDKYTGVVGWKDLAPHFRSDVLLYVDPALEIAEVGAAVSADDRDKVEAWLARGDLLRPGEPHAEFWEASDARFTALVVSPFVLIQPAGNRG